MELSELQKDVLNRGKTIHLSIEDYYDVVRSFSLGGFFSVMLSCEPNWVASIFGRLAYKVNDGYILFGSCDYCRTESSPEYKDEKLFCSECGVEIR